MPVDPWWLLAVLVAVVAVVVFEAWRQRRKYGRGSGRPNLLGVGALELQQHLQPDRKVEVLMQEVRKDEVTEPDKSPGRPADPPEPGP